MATKNYDAVIATHLILLTGETSRNIWNHFSKLWGRHDHTANGSLAWEGIWSNENVSDVMETFLITYELHECLQLSNQTIYFGSVYKVYFLCGKNCSISFTKRPQERNYFWFFGLYCGLGENISIPFGIQKLAPETLPAIHQTQCLSEPSLILPMLFFHLWN